MTGATRPSVDQPSRFLRFFKVGDTRWLRLYGDPAKPYCYVTLGGTELRDIHSLRFVDAKLTTTVCSYEMDRKRHELAYERAVELAAFGLTVDIQHGTFFSSRMVCVEGSERAKAMQGLSPFSAGATRT